MTNCPRCGGDVATGQEYYLECGLRLPVAGRVGSAPPDRRKAWLAVLLAALVATAGAGLAIGLTRETAAADTIVTATGGSELVKEPTVTNAAQLEQWPADRSGWTIVLVSVPKVEGRDAAVAHEDQPLADLQLLDVLGEVARGHALVDLLVAGEVVELLDARLHIVAGDFFPRHDRGRIHLVLHLFIGGDRFGRNIQPEIALRLHHGDPEFAFQNDPPFGGPDGLKGGRGVAFGEDVGNHARSLGGGL